MEYVPGKIGRVFARIRVNPETGEKFVQLLPYSKQDREGFAMAKQFIASVFQKDPDGVRDGRVIIPWESWRRTEGDKFIKAVVRNIGKVTWIDGSADKKIFKGLHSLLSPGAQAALGAPGPTPGGAPGAPPMGGGIGGMGAGMSPMPSGDMGMGGMGGGALPMPPPTGGAM